MAFAIVHFTVGFVVVLTALSIVPITRYRLTGAYLGGIWALVPDLHNVVGGAHGQRLFALHHSRAVDAFFFHYTLDGQVYRDHNPELIALSLVSLGVTLVAYDWRFGGTTPVTELVGTVDESDDVR